MTAEFKVDSRENWAGMTPSQTLENKLLDRFSRKPGYEASMRKWQSVQSELRSGKKNIWDKLERLGRTVGDDANDWLFDLVTKTIKDKDKVEKDSKYYELAQRVEKNWKKIEDGGLNKAIVDMDTKKVTVYGDQTILDVIADDIYGLATGSVESFEKVAKKAGGGSAMVVAAQLLSACSGPAVVEQTVVAPTMTEEAIVKTAEATVLKETIKTVNNVTILDFADEKMMAEYKNKDFQAIEQLRSRIGQSLERGWPGKGLSVESVGAQVFVVPEYGDAIIGTVEGKTYMLEVANIQSGKRYELNSEINAVKEGETITGLTFEVQGKTYDFLTVGMGQETGIDGIILNLIDSKVFIASGRIVTNSGRGFKLAAPEQVATATPTIPEATATKVPNETQTIPKVTRMPEATKVMESETKYYKLDFSKTYEVEYEGMNIPITFGLTKSMTERPVEPVKSFEVVDESKLKYIAESFLKACWLKYEADNGVNVAFGSYVNLVKQGKGQIKLFANDEASSKDKKDFSDVVIDPRDGVVKIFDDTDLPVLLDKYKFYVGKSSNNKLVIITNGLNYITIDQMKSSAPADRKALSVSLVFATWTSTGFGAVIDDADRELVKARLEGTVLRQFSMTKKTNDEVVLPYTKLMFGGQTDDNVWLRVNQ